MLGHIVTAALGLVLIFWSPSGRRRRASSQADGSSEPVAEKQSSGASRMGARVLGLVFVFWPVIFAGFWGVAFGNKMNQGPSYLQAFGLITVIAALVQLSAVLGAWRFGVSIPFAPTGEAALVFRRRERMMAASRAMFVMVISALGSAVVLILTMRSPLEELILPIVVLIVLGICTLRVRSYAHQLDSSPASALPEDDPMAREVRGIANAFGWAPPAVQIFAVINAPKGPRREGDSDQLLAGLDTWRQTFNPMRPALPVELVREIAPEAIGAGLAMRYANSALLNPMGLRNPASPALLHRAGWFWGACAALFVVCAGLIFAALSLLGGSFPAAVVLVCWIVLVVIFVGAIWIVWTRRRNFHRAAFEAWRAAGQVGSAPGTPESARTPEAFMAALATYDRAMRAGRITADELVARYRRDERLMAFLTRHGGEGEAQRALEAARMAAAEK